MEGLIYGARPRGSGVVTGHHLASAGDVLRRVRESATRDRRPSHGGFLHSCRPGALHAPPSPLGGEPVPSAHPVSAGPAGDGGHGVTSGPSALRSRAPRTEAGRSTHRPPVTPLAGRSAGPCCPYRT